AYCAFLCLLWLLLFLRVDLVGCRHAAARRAPGALGLKTLLQCGEELQHDSGPAVVSHQADSPGATLELAEAAADLDAELVEQALPNGQVVNAVGDPDGVQLRELAPLGGGVTQPQRDEPGLECPVVAQVTVPALPQPLLVQQAQPLAQ